MTPDNFKDNYNYYRGTLFDGFRDVRRSLSGDCDDYAWSMLLILEGSWLKAMKALIKGKAKFIRAKSPVNKRVPRHVVLKYNNLYTDSTNRKFREDIAPHDGKYTIPFPWVIFMVLWGMVVNKLGD